MGIVFLVILFVILIAFPGLAVDVHELRLLFRIDTRWQKIIWKLESIVFGGGGGIVLSKDIHQTHFGTNDFEFLALLVAFFYIEIFVIKCIQSLLGFQTNDRVK